jgi:hypothetical protein
LFQLLQQAYDELAEPGISMEDWCLSRSNESPQFNYWHQTLYLQTLMFAFTRSLREGNFDLYVQSLTKILPYLYAFDHTHYARWLSVHVRDLCTVQERHPRLHEEFQAGKFVVHKTAKKFSGIALDHCHEQNNALIKGMM